MKNGWNYFCVCFAMCFTSINNYSYEEEILALGHDYIKNDVIATCTTLGYTEFTCNRCGDYYTDFLDMKYHEYEVVEESSATCTESGYILLRMLVLFLPWFCNYGLVLE